MIRMAAPESVSPRQACDRTPLSKKVFKSSFTGVLLIPVCAREISLRLRRCERVHC